MTQTKDELELEILRQRLRKTTVEADRLERQFAADTAAWNLRDFTLAGPITASVVDRVRAGFEATLAHKDNDKPITLSLNSPGGEVFAGFGLYDFLNEQRRTVTIEITCHGYAASMAGIIMQAGTTRTMSPSSWFMIHEVSAMAEYATATQLRDQVEMVEALQARAVDALCSRSSLTPEFIEQKTLRKDWWLTAHEALEHGLIDAIRCP